MTPALGDRAWQILKYTGRPPEAKSMNFKCSQNLSQKAKVENNQGKTPVVNLWPYGLCMHTTKRASVYTQSIFLSEIVNRHLKKNQQHDFFVSP